MGKCLRAACHAALVGLVVVILAACGQSSSAPSAAGAGGRVAATAAPLKPEAAERPPLRVAYVTPQAAGAMLWVAKEAGAFERQGVAVELKYIQANAAVTALLADEVDLIQISAPGLIPAALQGADVVFIAGAFNQMIWSVHVAPEVRSAEDLRGKLFGTDRPGTPVGFGVEVALGKLGLAPTDVQLLNVGGSDQLLVALLSGQLSATILGPPASFAAEEAGYRKLIDLYDVPYQNIGIVARRARLPALEPSLVPFLRAYREGMVRYDEDKPFALEVIEKYTQESNPQIVDKTYEFHKAAGFNRSLTVSDDGIRSILGYLARTLPEAQNAQPSQFYDTRYIPQVAGSS